MSPIKRCVLGSWSVSTFRIISRDRKKKKTERIERKREIRWSADKLLYCLCAMGFCAIPADHIKCRDNKPPQSQGPFKKHQTRKMKGFKKL